MNVRFFRFTVADCLPGAIAHGTFTHLGGTLPDAIVALLESGAVVEISAHEWEHSLY